MNVNWEWFVQEYELINTFLMANVGFIANSIAATLLVLLSRDADKLFRDNVHKHFFVIRTALFILVCGVGYEFATRAMEQGFMWFLDKTGAFIFLLPILIAIFIGLGILAERKKYI